LSMLGTIFCMIIKFEKYFVLFLMLGTIFSLIVNVGNYFLYDY
jgi:hypothetical protein